MKQHFLVVSNKVDALSLRERVMVFAAAAGVLMFLVHSIFLAPLLAKQNALRTQIRQQHDIARGLDAELIEKAQMHSADPDAAERARLEAVNTEVAQLGATLRAMQKGLVAPDKITGLLESLLSGHGRLRLLRMKTLPVSGVSGSDFELPKEIAAPAKAPNQTQQILNNIQGTVAAGETKPGVESKAPAPKTPELLYRHGVEITLQGNYGDMVAYMAALEAMPSQLFWAKARLDAAAYPAVRLTLILYTLSLDEKWIAL